MNSVKREIIELEVGWRKLRSDAIDVLERFIDSSEFDPEVKKQKVFTNQQYTDLYTLCYEMCTQPRPKNFSADLYARYCDAVELYVKVRVLPQIEGLDGIKLLREYHRLWKTHIFYVRRLENILAYLDRYWVKVFSREPLYEQGVGIFRQFILVPIESKYSESLLNIVRDFRRGETNPEMLEILKTSVDDILGEARENTEVYQQFFGNRVVPEAYDYYKSQVSDWIQHLSLSDFLKQVERVLDRETELVERYLHKETTLEPLRLSMFKALLVETQQQILQQRDGLEFLLQNERVDDLQRLVKLYSLVKDGLGLFALKFKEHVIKRGITVIEAFFKESETRASTSLTELTEELMNLHNNLKKAVNVCFSNKTIFATGFKEGFETILNRFKHEGKADFAVLLSSYADRMLKNTEKKTEEDIQGNLTTFVELFAYLRDKDYFAEIYRKRLAKRLLQNTSCSECLEKILIGKLKTQCGTQFTSRMEGMIKDLSLARDYNNEYDQYLEKNGIKSDIEFRVIVLTVGYWPKFHRAEILTIPPILKECRKNFIHYYRQENPRRKLTWINSIGQCVMSTSFAKTSKTYEFSVNFCQASVLAQFSFSEPTRLSFSNLRTILDVTNDEYLQSVLASLIHEKQKILLKEPETEEILETDIFFVNEDFVSDSSKVRLQQPNPVDEVKPTKKTIEEDRSYAIDAAIVRVMKQWKKLEFNMLVVDVIRMCTVFQPQPLDIKNRIESLIQRDYLKRHAEDANVFLYLA